MTFILAVENAPENYCQLVTWAEKIRQDHFDVFLSIYIY